MGAPWPAFSLLTEQGIEIAIVEEVPEEVRGRYAYWMPCFQVTDLEGFRETLAQAGGEVSYEFPDGRRSPTSEFYGAGSPALERRTFSRHPELCEGPREPFAKLRVTADG